MLYLLFVLAITSWSNFLTRHSITQEIIRLETLIKQSSKRWRVLGVFVIVLFGFVVVTLLKR